MNAAHPIPKTPIHPNKIITPKLGVNTVPLKVKVAKYPAHMGPMALPTLPPNIERPLTLARCVDGTDRFTAIVKLEKEKLTAMFLIPRMTQRKI